MVLEHFQISLFKKVRRKKRANMTSEMLKELFKKTKDFQSLILHDMRRQLLDKQVAL